MTLDLKKIAKEINEEQSRFGQRNLMVLDSARKMGLLLMKVKDSLGTRVVPERNGKRTRTVTQFKKWVTDNCAFCFVTAARYMRVARHYDEGIAWQKKHPGEVLSYYRFASEILKVPSLMRGPRTRVNNARSEDAIDASHDKIAAAKVSSDGDLIETLVDILADRDNIEWILGRVLEKVKLKKKGMPASWAS